MSNCSNPLRRGVSCDLEDLEYSLLYMKLLPGFLRPEPTPTLKQVRVIQPSHTLRIGTPRRWRDNGNID